MECYASPITTFYIYFFSFIKLLKFNMKKKKKCNTKKSELVKYKIQKVVPEIPNGLKPILKYA